MTSAWNNPNIDFYRTMSSIQDGIKGAIYASNRLAAQSMVDRVRAFLANLELIEHKKLLHEVIVGHGLDSKSNPCIYVTFLPYNELTRLHREYTTWTFTLLTGVQNGGLFVQSSSGKSVPASQADVLLIEG